jgi:hypothetical protein
MFSPGWRSPFTLKEDGSTTIVSLAALLAPHKYHIVRLI